MQIELYMTKVSYKHINPPINKQLPVQSIHVGERVEKKDKNEWVIPTHYRSYEKDSIRQIGIRFTNKKNQPNAVMITSPDNQSMHSFVYNSKADIWYEPTFFSNKKKSSFYQFDEATVLTGIVNAGTVLLHYIVDNYSKKVGTLHFIPSALSIKDYDEMVADLYQIREDLVRDERNLGKTTIRSKSLIMELKEQLEQLTRSIHLINQNPHVVLAMEQSKKNPDFMDVLIFVSKWRSISILENLTIAVTH